MIEIALLLDLQKSQLIKGDLSRVMPPTDVGGGGVRGIWVYRVIQGVM